MTIPIWDRPCDIGSSNSSSVHELVTDNYNDPIAYAGLLALAVMLATGFSVLDVVHLAAKLVGYNLERKPGNGWTWISETALFWAPAGMIAWFISIVVLYGEYCVPGDQNNKQTLALIVSSTVFGFLAVGWIQKNVNFWKVKSAFDPSVVGPKSREDTEKYDLADSNGDWSAVGSWFQSLAPLAVVGIYSIYIFDAQDFGSLSQLAYTGNVLTILASVITMVDIAISVATTVMLKKKAGVQYFINKDRSGSKATLIHNPTLSGSTVAAIAILMLPLGLFLYKNELQAIMFFIIVGLLPLIYVSISSADVYSELLCLTIFFFYAITFSFYRTSQHDKEWMTLLLNTETEVTTNYDVTLAIVSTTALITSGFAFVQSLAYFFEDSLKL